jgi:Flp pilus assembly protein TadG
MALEMRTSPRRVHRRRFADETGMSLVFVSVGFMAFFAATTLAIDVGLFMTARSQSQNAADAGALSGAVAFVYDSFDDRSPGGPAVQSAINTALANPVIGGDVSVGPTDVTFPIGTNGQYNRVKVTVYRSAARNNPIPTLIGPIFGVDDFDILATATAEAAPANAMTCVKPFTIPDKWIEKQDLAWTMDSTFDRYDNKGNLLANPDIYIPPSDAHQTWTEDDKGTYFVLRAGTGNNIAPTMYSSWKMPDDIGGNFYEENIAGCNPSVVGFNYQMNQEPGAMAGPTISGIQKLIDKDPTAYWDTNEKRVVSPNAPSPRVFPIPLYDPDLYQNGMQTGRNATLIVRNWLGFFVEGYAGNEVYGRIVPITGVIDPNLGPAPAGAFPKAIRLVQ